MGAFYSLWLLRGLRTVLLLQAPTLLSYLGQTTKNLPPWSRQFPKRDASSEVQRHSDNLTRGVRWISGWVQSLLFP